MDRPASLLRLRLPRVPPLQPPVARAGRGPAATGAVVDRDRGEVLSRVAAAGVRRASDPAAVAPAPRPDRDMPRPVRAVCPRAALLGQRRVRLQLHLHPLRRHRRGAPARARALRAIAPAGTDAGRAVGDRGCRGAPGRPAPQRLREPRLPGPVRGCGRRGAARHRHGPGQRVGAAVAADGLPRPDLVRLLPEPQLRAEPRREDVARAPRPPLLVRRRADRPALGDRGVVGRPRGVRAAADPGRPPVGRPREGLPRAGRWSAPRRHPPADELPPAAARSTAAAGGR